MKHHPLLGVAVIIVVSFIGFSQLPNTNFLGKGSEAAFMGRSEIFEITCTRKGDVNRDGDFSPRDLRELYLSLNGKNAPCPEQKDYNGDGVVNQYDLLAMIEALQGVCEDSDKDGVCNQYDRHPGEFDYLYETSLY